MRSTVDLKRKKHEKRKLKGEEKKKREMIE